MSGLQVGTFTFKIFLSFLHLNPSEDNILSASLIFIGIPIIFSNFLISNFIILFSCICLPVIINLLASPPQILMINSAAILSSRAVFLIEDGEK